MAKRILKRNKQELPIYIIDPYGNINIFVLKSFMLVFAFFSIVMMPLTVGLGEETVLESTREWELFFDYLLLIHLPLMLLTAMEDDAD